MVGNDDVAAALDRELTGKVFRYVNAPDPVPKLPTVSLLANHYCHCQAETVLGAAAAAGAATTSAVDFFKQLATKTADGVIQGTLLDDVWSAIKSRVSAHAMENYRKLLGELKSGP